MELSRALEQHIAVFGESGSGKTVLVSSFYGATQERQFMKSSLFDVVADDTGQGFKLHKYYLGMKESASAPAQTQFASTSYAFSVKLKQKSKKTDGKHFDALRLVWHDYPGEWFQQEVRGIEAERRVETFKSLLGSDVALLLVDGQKLLDNAGEESRYLKALFNNFRTGLLRLKDELLEGGKPLVSFPRIWVMALSKADLLPDIDVFKFRDILISQASDEIQGLRDVLATMVESNEALAVGEDFLLLSSAKFEANKIEVTERIGLDLILPVAAVLPFERHTKWVQEKRIAAGVAEVLLSGAEALALALIGSVKKGQPGLLSKLIGGKAASKAISAAVVLVGDKLRDKHSEALAKQDHMAAALTGFRIDLDTGEEELVLLRSKK